ncbi:hypothetical protein STEG23_035335 [Scotinomys teguina]
MVLLTKRDLHPQEDQPIVSSITLPMGVPELYQKTKPAYSSINDSHELKVPFTIPEREPSLWSSCKELLKGKSGELCHKCLLIPSRTLMTDDRTGPTQVQFGEPMSLLKYLPSRVEQTEPKTVKQIFADEETKSSLSVQEDAFPKADLADVTDTIFIALWLL